MLACTLKAVYGVLFLVEPTLSFLIATHEFGVSADTNKAINLSHSYTIRSALL